MKVKNLTKKIKFLIVCVLTFVICTLFGVLFGAKDVTKMQTANAATGHSAYFYIKGASVRVIDDENGHGIRFHVVMTKGMYDAYVDQQTGELSDTVTTGTLIIPTKLLAGEALTIETEDVLSIETTDIWFENADGNMESIAYVYDIPATNYRTELTAVGYVQQGAGEAVYTQAVSGFSMSWVASAEINNPNSSLSAEDITSLKNTYALCTVHYLDQNGAELKSEAVVYGSKITPPEYTVEEGNVFYGWFNKKGNVQWDVENDGVKADVWLYAKEDNPYSLSTRQDIDLQLNDDGSINTSKMVTLNLSEIDDGWTVTSVAYNGAEIATSATFNVSVFGRDYGEKNLFVTVQKDAETLTYKVPVTLISRIISDRAELLIWSTIAKACEADASLWGGYFTLDANISVNCSAGWTGASNLLVNMGSGDGSTSGFKGTWDGRGYKINSMWLAPGADKAFVSGLHKDGVIKNIAFTDAAVGNGSYVVAWGQGTLENLYVQYSYYGMRAVSSNTGYATNYEAGNTATFYGVVGNSGLHRNIVNCVIDFSSENVFTAQSSSNGSHVIGKVYDYADFQGVYLIGSKSWMNILQHWDTKGNYYQVKAGDTLPAGEVYLCDTADDWKTAGNNECLYNWEQRQLDLLGATKLVGSGSSGSENATVVLSEKLADLNLSVVNGALVGVDEVRIDLSEIGKYPGSLFTASFNGAKLSGAYIDGKTLVVPATAFDQKGGEGTLNVTTTLGKYEMPLIVASKVIYTVDDYNTFGDVAKLLGAAEGSLIWDGYFALGANLSQTGGIVLNEFIDRSKVSLVRDGTDGFKGTFNGRGYAIDGLSRTVNTSNAFITALHTDGVLKNIAFTNVTFSSPNGSFLCGGGKGKIENVYVQYKEISNGNTSGYGGTVYSANTSVTSLFVDASACTMTGDGTSFRLIGAVTPSGQSYCLYPANYTASQAREGGLNSSTVQAFASKAAMLADATAQGKLAGWNSNYWTIVSGVPVFKNVKENGTAYVNVTLSDTNAIDLDLTVNAQGDLVYSNAQATIDLSAYGVDFGKVVRATYNGNVIAVSLRNGVLSIPVAQFGKNHSTQTDTLVVETTNGKITAPVFLYSMVIETVDEYAIWTDVAYALGYDNGGWHYWDGYFALGANLSAEGGIALNEGIHRDLVGSASGAAGGFAGTFDGCGYTIDGLTKNSDLKSGFVGVIAGGTLKNIAFTNAVYNGAQGGFISFAGKGTYEDIYVSYASVSGVVAGNYAGTFDVGNSGSTMRRVFISAENTVWDDSSKANFSLAGKGNYYGGLFGIDNRLTGADTTSFNGTIGSGWAELIRFQSKAQKGMFETYYNNSASSYSKAINTWLTTCDSWTVVNGIPTMGGKTYTVTFENADGSVLSTQTVKRGEMPVAPQSPTIDSGDPFISYAFIGWDKEIVVANGNVTYTAVYVSLSTHSHNYSESYEDNGDGTHTAYCDCGASVTEGHAYQWEAQANQNVQICSVCGNEGESVLTQLSTAQDINLDLTISGGALATRSNAVAIDVTNASALPLTRNSVTYNGQEVVSTATFGHDFGEKNVVVKAATADGYVHAINVPVLLISKVITTRDDLTSRATDSFDKIAKLLGAEYNDTNGENIWDGYFVLGGNINVNGRGAGKWVGYQGPFMTIEKDQSGASGWKGVLDGRNYTVDSLTVAKNSEESAFISGLHKDGIIRNINFTNAGVGYCSYVVAWGQGTVENVHVQVQGWGVSGATATTYTKDYDRKSTAVFFGRAYNTAIGEPQNGNLRRVINCTVDMSVEEYLRAQGAYSLDAFEYGAMLGLSPDDTYENTYVIGADGWMNVLNYWHTFNEAQYNATANSYVSEYGTWGAFASESEMNAAIDARGVSEYVIIYDGDSRNATKAAAYLKTQFYNAEGIRITAMKEAPVAVDGAKYIVLGNETLFDQAGLTLPWSIDENSTANYYAKTDGNNVFLMSRNDDYQPVLYYFLEEVLGYNALGLDLIVFDKEITWNADTTFNVTEKSATAVGERLVGTTMTGNESYSMGFNGVDTFVEGYAMEHNTFKLLPYDTYAATHPEWYSSGTCAIQTEYGGATTNVDVSQEGYRQLCFTAGGNQSSYELMVKTLVDNLLPYLKASTETNVMIGIEDNRASCACGNCDTSNPTNDYIRFLNDVDEELQTRNLGRTITLYSMAYWKYLEAPTTVVPNNNVGTVICYTWMDNTTTLDDTTSAVNTEYFNRLKAWSAKTDKLGAWFYITNCPQYFFPLNNYKTLIDNYNIVHEYGTDIIMSQGIGNGERVQSHFSAFKTYIYSRVMRDLSVTYEELEAEFFGFTKSGTTITYNDKGYYGSAAAAKIMHTYYLELIAHLDTLTNTTKHGTLQEDIANGAHWTWSALSDWENDVNRALALYEDDTDSVYYKHIFAESLFPKYAKLTLFAERTELFGYVSWSVNKTYWTDKATWVVARDQFIADCTTLDLEYYGEDNLIETWLTE